MKRKQITEAGEFLIAVEAARRARHEPRSERMSTKKLAGQIGLTYGHVANLLSQKRRVLEGKAKVNVSPKPARHADKSPEEFERIVAEVKGMM